MPSINLNTLRILFNSSASNAIRSRATGSTIIYAKCIKVKDLLESPTALSRRELPGMTYPGNSINFMAKFQLQGIQEDSYVNVVILKERACDSMFVENLGFINSSIVSHMNNMIDNLCNELMHTSHPVAPIQEIKAEVFINPIEPIKKTPVAKTDEVIATPMRVKSRKCIDF